MQTLVNSKAVSVMQPLSHRLTPLQTSGEALTLMQQAQLDFVPVVTADSGELLGIVLKKALENGCERMGHDLNTCPLSNHLKLNIETCCTDDPVADNKRNGRRRLPVVVVDESRSPIGYIE